MMHHPADHWFKYMLLFSGLSIEQILDSAKLYEFDPLPDAGYLAKMEAKLLETKPSPFNIRFKKTKSWLSRHNVLSLAREQSSALEARQILSSNKVRSTLEALLMTGEPMKEVVEALELATGKKISQKTASMYQHYFWNIPALTLADLADFLKQHPRGWFLKGGYNNGIEFVLWKLGIRVEMSHDEVLKQVFHEASMRFFETKHLPNNKDTAMTAKMWSESLFKAQEELAKTGDPVKEVLEELKQVALKLGKQEILSVEEVCDLPVGDK